MPLITSRHAPTGVQPSGTVWIEGGGATVGTNSPEHPQDGEGPIRHMAMADFGLEAEAVTVKRFAEFIQTTGYVTEAERFGWSAVSITRNRERHS